MLEIYFDINEIPYSGTLTSNNRRIVMYRDGFMKINVSKSSGKWYFEFINEYVQYLSFIGFVKSTFNKDQSFGGSWSPGAGTNYGGYDDRFGLMVAPNSYNPGAYSVLNSNYLGYGYIQKIPNGSRISIIWDVDNGHLKYLHNGLDLIEFDYPVEFIGEELYFGFGGHMSNTGIIIPNKENFMYSVPDGYKALQYLNILNISYEIKNG